MKKILSAILVVSLMFLCACGGKVNPDPGPGPTPGPTPTPGPADVSGCWELTSVATKSATVGSQTVDVYLSFNSGKFEIYQRTGTSPRYYKFTGTYSLKDNVLSGKYDDGKDWSATYSVSVSSSTLTLTASKETDTYKKISSIPSGLLL